jgi:hypothetical protein
MGSESIGIILNDKGLGLVWSAHDGEMVEENGIIPSGVTATAIGWGWFGGCIVDEKGYLWCNGMNSHGEVGVG